MKLPVHLQFIPGKNMAKLMPLVSQADILCTFMIEDHTPV